MELIDRYTHGDLELQDKLNEGMKIYKNSEGYFARRAAIHEWNTIMPGKLVFDALITLLICDLF